MYTYDIESRITNIDLPGTTADPSYTYNGLDTRIGQVISGNTTSWKRSGAYVTESVLNEGSTAFTPGVSSRNGSTSTFTHAGLKNTDRQSTTTSLSATRQYDAFGNLVSSTGTWTTRFGYAGNFGYQGDDNTGLKLLGHRYYDSSTGRFLTRDPIKDGRNWYGYGGGEGNSLTNADPTGLFAEHLLDPSVWQDGLTTSGLALGAAVGVIDPEAHIGRPGFSESMVSWEVADLALTRGAGGLRKGARETLEMAEHRRGKRRSTKGKHEEGQSRFDCDRGKKEKGGCA